MVTFLTFFALALVIGGPAAAYFQLVSPLIAAGMSVTGLLLLAIFFFVTVVKVFRRDFFSWAALIFGLFALAGLGGIGYFAFLNPLHDVTTDLKNPPQFRHPAYPFSVGAGSEYLDESLRLKREFNPLHSATHQELYPTITSLQAKVPSKEAYAAVLKTVQTQFPTWKIVLNDPEARRLEAETAEPVFGFISDVVVELRWSAQHEFDSTIDMRSRMRVPLPDFGWDASVLRNLRVQLEFGLGPLEDQFAKRRSDFEADPVKFKGSSQQPAQPAPAAAPAPAVPTAPVAPPAPAAPTAPATPAQKEKAKK